MKKIYMGLSILIVSLLTVFTTVLIIQMVELGETKTPQEWAVEEALEFYVEFLDEEEFYVYSVVEANFVIHQKYIDEMNNEQFYAELFEIQLYDLAREEHWTILVMIAYKYENNLYGALRKFWGIQKFGEYEIIDIDEEIVSDWGD